MTNDDGPPSTNESPFLHGFVKALKGASPTPESWTSDPSSSSSTKSPSDSPLDVRVVIPNSQRSWIGKAYLIKDRIKGIFYYTPLETGDGQSGEALPQRREKQKGEEEWVLLDGTPASCSNIGLFNLFPNEIDLVLSGPNFGRNTSSAFSLSSGTVGAALDAALSGYPAIALSYGIFERPIQDAWVARAHEIAVRVIKRLWEHGFGDGAAADLYSVNIPLVEAILAPEVEIVWTTESTTRYDRLFAPTASLAPPPALPSVPGPTVDPDSSGFPPPPAATDLSRSSSTNALPLDFRFSPNISRLVDPKSKVHKEGTDAEALNRGKVTVSPLRARFASGGPPTGSALGEGKTWKL